MPINIENIGPNNTIHIKVDYGQSVYKKYLSNKEVVEYKEKQFTLDKSSWIYWIDDEPDGSIVKSRDIYIQMIVYENDYIIGYLVLNIYSYQELGMVYGEYAIKILKMQIYYKKNYQYQSISLEFVQLQINEIIVYNKK